MKSKDLALLSKKYAGVLDVDGAARLEILTQRIRNLNPRITEDNLTLLTNAVNDVTEISDGIAALKKRLKI